MSREWQQTKMKEYVMPDAVYYQSIWAVRDLERMENRIEELKSNIDDKATSSLVKENFAMEGNVGNPIADKAMELVILEDRVSSIKKAIDIMPEGYRCYVLSNIIMKNSGASFPNKFWRLWKQKFLFTVAKNLSLM